MELYASGFNAWDQLRFDKTNGTEPEDISGFTCVLKDDTIHDIKAFLSYTLGESQEALQTWLRLLFASNDEPPPPSLLLFLPLAPPRTTTVSLTLTALFQKVTTSSGLRSAGLIPKEDAALLRQNERASLTIAQAANGVVAGTCSPGATSSSSGSYSSSTDVTSWGVFFGPVLLAYENTLQPMTEQATSTFMALWPT